jgi:hypothetical protein
MRAPNILAVERLTAEASLASVISRQRKTLPVGKSSSSGGVALER